MKLFPCPWASDFGSLMEVCLSSAFPFLQGHHTIIIASTQTSKHPLLSVQQWTILLLFFFFLSTRKSGGFSTQLWNWWWNILQDNFELPMWIFFPNTHLATTLTLTIFNHISILGAHLKTWGSIFKEVDLHFNSENVFIFMSTCDLSQVF